MMGNIDVVRFMRGVATPLATGMFIVTATSGIALFFHVAPAAFHAMHVWLSMVWLLPFGLHIWRNWHPFIAYAKRGALFVPVLVCVTIALPFAYAGLAGGRETPGFKMTAVLTQASIDTLAPVLKTTPDQLVEALKQHGFHVASTAQTIRTVAAASGKPPNEVLFAILPAR
jgi:hypothetical protein